MSRLTCCVPGCGFNLRLKHRIPVSDNRLTKEWLARINSSDLLRCDATSLNNRRVCDGHFSDHCKMHVGSKKLITYAVPNQNLPGFQEAPCRENAQPSWFRSQFPPAINLESTGQLIDSTVTNLNGAEADDPKEIEEMIVDSAPFVQKHTFLTPTKRVTDNDDLDVALLKKKEHNSKENFNNWLESVVEVFGSLLPYQKEATLMRMISESSPELKYVLVRHVSEILQQDILTFIPNDLKVKVFSYVDGKSMLAACGVSKKWNGIISSVEDVWRVKCIEDGFQKIEASSWKEKYVKGLRFIERMLSSRAFSIKSLRMNMFAGEGVSELFVSSGYLFASAGRQVCIWHVGTRVDDLLVLYFTTDNRISSMCDYETKCFICGHNSGHISMWTWELDRTIQETANFVAHVGPVVSVAVSKDVGLIASGGADRLVKLWCLESKQLLFTHAKYSSFISKVILVPTFNLEAVNKGKFVLLVRSKNLINLFHWSLQTSNVCSSCKHGVLEEMLNDTTSIAIEDYSMKYFPDQYCINEGKLFYVRNPLLSEMLVYDLNTKRDVGTIDMADKYPFVLAAGGKFVLVMKPAESLNYGFSLLNISTKSEVVKWSLPFTRFHHNILRVAVPSTSWLDDVSHHVPGQLLLAFTDTVTHINFVFWKGA